MSRATASAGGGPERPLLLVLLGGVVWGLCFERTAMPVLAWAALVPACWLLGGRRPGLACWGVGTISWFLALRWIPGTLETYGGLPWLLSWLLLLPLALYLGSYLGLWGALGARLWRAGGLWAGVGLPALWCALEWLRTYALSGFPWNLAAYAWTEQPGALALAPWIGAYGVSALLVGVNVAIARELPRRRLLRLTAVLAAPVGLLLAAAWLDARAASRPTADAPVPAAVTLVQPNTPNQVGWDPAVALAAYQRLVDLSLDACDGTPRLLLWPESAAFPYSYAREPQLREDLAQLAARGCEVLFNSAMWRGERYYNSVLLVGEEGLLASYEKRHLVPFGEYVPLASVFRFIESLARNAGDFSPGEGVSLLTGRAGPVGAALCYEIVFPEEVAETVRAGAEILVTLTNDAWYGDTAAPWQHFRAGRFRAAENRRTVLRAAITGVSGVIDPHGRVLASLGVDELGTVSAEVVPRSDLTPQARAPWAVPLASSLFALFAIFRCRGAWPESASR